MRKIPLYAVIQLIALQTFAQNWVQVSNGFNDRVNHLYTDPLTNKLYAFGEFTYTDTTNVAGRATYDGIGWDTFPMPFPLWDVQRSYRFGNKLIFGGNSIYIYDGQSIATIATTNSSVLGYSTFQGDLIAYGHFDTINNIAAHSIARWDGSAWSAFDTTKFTQGIVAVQEYQGQLYIGGNFCNLNCSLNRLARWNGNGWLPVGNGIPGSLGVSCFAIYNGDLYVAGGFKEAYNAPGNSVARWNGSQWKDAGAGMTSLNAVVYDLQVYDGHLYACGQFYEMGDASIKGIAKWNGLEWCGLGQQTTPSFHNFIIHCMQVYNNELYIGGPFKTIDGDTVNYVAKWVGGNYVDTCAALTALPNIETHFTLTPNPATTELSLQLSDPLPNATLQLYAIDGRTAMEPIKITEPTTTVSIAHLPAGIYIAHLHSSNGQWQKKIVKY
ncbi:MAG: T9SS type A sorting domain-containing protein [Chitinophagales bacterium]|nr:T9SS type A sorting domain-containing protein [Chitinophagales bacterium]